MSLNLSVGYTDKQLLDKAAQLASDLQLPINNQAIAQLVVDFDKLMLVVKPFQPLFIDFSAEHWEKRRQEGKSQTLVKACKPKQGLKIVDATAGWGRDAAILASFGAEVVMVERNPIMARLLQDALDRQDEKAKKKLKLSLIQENSGTYLSNLTSLPDLIYLDPMHPVREKSALVKKDLQLLQQLIGPDLDASELLTIARSKAQLKVIVKWPVNAASLATPDIVWSGKTVRYDGYLPKKM